jgi:hypothetical protein
VLVWTGPFDIEIDCIAVVQDGPVRTRPLRNLGAPAKPSIDDVTRVIFAKCRPALKLPAYRGGVEVISVCLPRGDVKS